MHKRTQSGHCYCFSRKLDHVCQRCCSRPPVLLPLCVPVPHYQEHVMSGNCIQYLLSLIIEGFFCLVFRFIGWCVHLNYCCLFVFKWNLALIIRSLTGDQLSRHLLAYLVITIATPLCWTSSSLPEYRIISLV